MIVDAYLDTARAAVDLLRSPGVAHHWSQSSALPEFRISGLAGHLGVSVFLVAPAIEADVPDEEPVDAALYFARSYTPAPSPDEPKQRHIRNLGEEAAGDGPADLIARLDAALADLATTLPALPPDRLVFTRRGVLRLDQWLVTRMIELAVHMDDLAVSIDVPTPDLTPESADLVITALARIAVIHHGAVPVLRALSRQERAIVSVTAF
jgi:hypothetical protein